MIPAIQVELSMRRNAEPQRAATAWLIQGADSGAWLEEISKWKLDERTLRLHVIPVSRNDLTPGGVFVTAEGVPAQTPAAIPFGIVTGGLYVPVHAIVSPPLKAGEWEAMAGYPLVVFLPVDGLVAFESIDGNSIAGVLLSPEERQVEWVGPPVEIEPHPHIESIAIRPVPLSLEDLFGSESVDIGSELPEEFLKPPVEPKRGMIGKGMDRLREAGLKATEWLLSSGPAGKKGGETAGAQGKKQPLAGLKKWLEERFQPPSRQQLSARDRALRDLLEQLQKNPDEALKHALPLASAFMARGVAPPGSRLGNRSTDFSIKRLGGGRSVDPWNIEQAYRQQLREHYLRLAERERQNGRYRRAAYIHSELLGDLTACAGVLMEGKFWHEAALIHKDHLHNPMEAARCFVEARMIPDAVAIYKKENAFEKLGELYKQLGEEENATEAYRSWVGKLKGERKLHDAAKVLDEKLSAREEALALLESAWPEHPDVKRCLERALLMRAETGNHEDSAKLVRRLAAEPFHPRGTMELIHVFCLLQTTYPDRGVCLEAEDCGRQIISRVLESGDEFLAALKGEMAHRLPYLAPDDRLLYHDSMRFLHPSKSPAKASSARKPASKVAAGSYLIELKRKREFQLPRPGKQLVRWIKMMNTQNGVFWGMGVVHGSGLLVTRSDFQDDHQFQGNHQFCVWDDRADLAQAGPLDAVFDCLKGRETDLLIASIAGAPPLSMRGLPRSGSFEQGAMIGGAWLGAPIIAATYGPGDLLWAARETPTGGLISGFLPDGRIHANIPVPSFQNNLIMEGTPPMALKVHLTSVRSHLVCSVGNGLYGFKAGEAGAVIPSLVLLSEFDEPILGLERSAQWETPHVKVNLQSGIALCWLDTTPCRIQMLEGTFRGSVSAFTSNGNIIIIASDGGYIFAINSNGKSKSARFSWNDVVPLAIVSGSEAGTFCTVGEDGRVVIHEYSLSGLK